MQAASDAKWEQRMAKDMDADPEAGQPGSTLSAADQRQLASLRQVSPPALSIAAAVSMQPDGSCCGTISQFTLHTTPKASCFQLFKDTGGFRWAPTYSDDQARDQLSCQRIQCSQSSFFRTLHGCTRARPWPDC